MLNVINKAIDWKYGSTVADVTDITNLSEEAKTAVVAWLKNYVSTNGYDKTHMILFTDAMGLATKSSLNLYNYGYYGHLDSYNQTNGIVGANTEGWANYCSMVFNTNVSSQYGPSMEAMTDLMPQTMKVMGEKFEEIEDYSNSHCLTFTKYNA